MASVSEPRDDSFIARLKQRLEDELWKSALLERTATLRSKVDTARKNNVKLSKGTGGNVSAVRKTLVRIERLAQVLKAASHDTGLALVHGSVALTRRVENSKNSIDDLRKAARTYRVINIQNHPFVDLGKNCTVEAYTLWHDYRLGLAAERYVRRSYGLSDEKEEGEVGEFDDDEEEEEEAVAAKRKRKVPSDKDLRNEVLVVKRALMRKDVLSTLVFEFDEESPFTAEFGSTQVRFCAMTYRPMPADIENEIRSSGMTAQRVIDVVQHGRRKYETFFTSADNFANSARRARPVPSKQMKSYFDKEQYVEDNLLHRIYAAAESKMVGAAAVAYVYNTEQQGDENLCQRAFAHWLLDELKAVFGTSFADSYKSGIVRGTRVCPAQLCALFGQMHKDLSDVIFDYHATLDTTAKSKTRVSKSVALPQAPKALHTALAHPVSSAFEKNEKHTRLQVLTAERTRKRRVKQGRPVHGGSFTLPLPSADCWRQPFESTLSPVEPCPAQEAHAVHLTHAAHSLLEKALPRRTESEVIVGEAIVQSATNATDARVAARTRAVEQTHDVGGASRRMLTAHATKPVPSKDYIHHTQRNGLLKEQNERRDMMQRFEEPLRYEQTLSMSVLRRRAQLLVSEFDCEFVPESQGVVMQQCNTHLDYLKFVYATGEGFSVEGAHAVCAALLQSRTPARTAAETNNALLNSDALRRTIESFGCKCIEMCFYLNVNTLPSAQTLIALQERVAQKKKRKRS